MDLKELKQEAAKHGYRLVKKKEYVNLLPCPCGNRRREKWWTTKGTYFFRCSKCGFTGGEGASENKARKIWNEAVEHAGCGT